MGNRAVLVPIGIINLSLLIMPIMLNSVDFDRAVHEDRYLALEHVLLLHEVVDLLLSLLTTLFYCFARLVISSRISRIIVT